MRPSGNCCWRTWSLLCRPCCCRRTKQVHEHSMHTTGRVAKHNTTNHHCCLTTRNMPILSTALLLVMLHVSLHMTLQPPACARLHECPNSRLLLPGHMGAKCPVSRLLLPGHIRARCPMGRPPLPGLHALLWKALLLSARNLAGQT